MNTSKYPLEICGCRLPFWYSTPRKISDQTTPDFNLLTAARSQDQIDVIIWSSLFGGDVAGLSVAIRYRASKSNAPTCNLVTTIEFSCDGFLSGLRFRAGFWTKLSFWRISPPFEPRLRIVNSAWHNLIVEEDCCFIAPKTYQVILLFETLATYHFERVFSRLVAGSPLSLTLSQSEGTLIAVLLSIIFDGLF
jgi:hypothetical protein